MEPGRQAVALRAGGSVEVDDSVLRAQGWRATCLRSTAACSRSGMRRRRAPRLGSRWWHAPRLGSRWRHALRLDLRQWCALGPGLRTASGGDRRARALGGFEKLLSVVSESHWFALAVNTHYKGDTK
jgi:hypothetical protein